MACKFSKIFVNMYRKTLEYSKILNCVGPTRVLCYLGSTAGTKRYGSEHEHCKYVRRSKFKKAL